MRVVWHLVAKTMQIRCATLAVEIHRRIIRSVVLYTIPPAEEAGRSIDFHILPEFS